MQVPDRLGVGLRAFWALAGLLLLAFVAHATLGLGGSGLDSFFEDWVYNGVTLGAALACLLRAHVIRQERLPWLLMGLGLLAWTGGDLYWTLILADDPSPPYPSAGDALYLAFYPASYATLVLLARSRMIAFRTSLWLDGAIAALAVGAFAAALAFPPIIDATSGSTAEVAVNLAYPVGDLVLLGLVVALFGLSGWRPGRMLLLLGTGLALNAVSDVIYLVQAANGTYQPGTLLDVAWPAAAVLVALAAWQAPHSAVRTSLSDWRVVAIPFACGLAANGLLVADHFSRINLVALLLTAACLVLVVVCMALVFRENQRILHRTAAEARTDALTGLRNRRSLMSDLELELALASEAEPRALLLFDLDGFKEYNDAFGHLAGDGLLTRLGAQLADAVHGHGLAYRLGGDEFCALVRPGVAGVKPLMAACVEALAEHGEGFDVSTSHGSVLLPEEADTPTQALQLADRRMYARKGGRRMSAGRQSRDVLLRTLSERRPDLHARQRGVVELALALGAGARDGARAARRGGPCRRASRPGQDRRARRHPGQARAAGRGRVGLHAPAHDRGRAHPARGARAAPRGAAGSLEPRALGRFGLSGRAGGRGDPARRTRGGGLRRLRRDDLRPPLSRRDVRRRGARRTARLCGRAVRPGRGQGLCRGAGAGHRPGLRLRALRRG